MKKTLIIIGGLICFNASASPSYTFIDLNMLGESYSTAYSINNSNQIGMIQGVATPIPSGGFSIELIPAVWENSSIALASQGNRYDSQIYKINDSGQVLINTFSSGTKNGAIWETSNNTITILKTEEFSGGVTAWDINNSGQTVGSIGASAVTWVNKDAIPIDIAQPNDF